MSFKSFLVKTGTTSLKAVRAVWKGFLVMMASFGYGLVECMKNASPADDHDSTSDESILSEAASYEADDWVARNYDLD